MRSKQSTKELENTPLLEHDIDKREIKMSYKKMPVFWCTIQLLTPLIMGILINALSNNSLMKRRAAFQMEFAKSYESAKSDDLPKIYWIPANMYPIGGLIGSLLAGFTVQKWGRKYTSFAFCFNVILGSLIKFQSYYSNIYVLFLGRFFDGIGSAGLMVTSILHIFECLPEQFHNIFKPLIQVNVNLGILIQCVLQLNSVCHDQYQYTFLSSLVLVIILMISIAALPESPIYLLDVKKDEKAALKAYQQLRGDIASEYLNLIKLKNESEKEIATDSNLTVTQLFTFSRFRGAIFASIFCHIAQQLSGINAVVGFSNTYLENIGVEDPDKVSLIVPIMALIGSIIFSPCVSAFKRKFALIIGHSGMFISLLGLILSDLFNFNKYFQPLFMGLFVFVFQFGPGPLVWFITLEIFPPNATGSAQSVCSIFNWLANSLVFSIAGLGNSVLYFFLIVNALMVIFILMFVAETKNRDSNEILDDYVKKFKCIS